MKYFFHDTHLAYIGIFFGKAEVFRKDSCLEMFRELKNVCKKVSLSGILQEMKKDEIPMPELSREEPYLQSISGADIAVLERKK